MDELTLDNIFVTRENVVKVAVLECVIHAYLRKSTAAFGIRFPLSTDSTRNGSHPGINTYPLGT